MPTHSAVHRTRGDDASGDYTDTAEWIIPAWLPTQDGLGRVGCSAIGDALAHQCQEPAMRNRVEAAIDVRCPHVKTIAI